jgi:hypothetical protein
MINKQMFRHFDVIYGLIVVLVVWSPLRAQDLSGQWVGEVWQELGDTFHYQIRLQQDGPALSGQVYTRATAGELEAEFLLSGRYEAGRIQLQEVQQLRPAAPQWCLKYLQLEAQESALVGTWTARGCRDGFIRLYREGSLVPTLPFSYPGRWTGYLGQTDREYGFYFELTLGEDGRGTSHIVSEGAGGEATHGLRWRETGTGIHFSEYEVIRRTNADWKWCLKTADLSYDATQSAYQLNGSWTGYLEHKGPVDGACAPGTLHLTKPVLTEAVQAEVIPRARAYTEATAREVKIDRIIRVQAEKIRLKVWDHGVVDGDVLTLFLNGERIIEKYRVSKRKWSIPVNIIKGENLLILHAEDLGDIKPNTVAVSIDDGVEEQIIILSSNLEESGAILIQPFVVD